MVAHLNAPKLIKGEIMHRRFFPKKNYFNYKSVYIAFPISQLKQLKNTFFSLNTFNLFGFKAADYGDNGENFSNWIYDLLAENDIDGVEEIALVTHPKILGYAFNPVSFWLCFNANNELIAVLSDVTNTAKQRHHYLCYKADLSPINQNDYLRANKEFYVSPFMKVEGVYEFRFELLTHGVNFYIRYLVDDKIQLSTSLKCHYVDFNRHNLLMCFFRVPLATLKTTILIHYQAIKLLFKSLKYDKYPKPLNHNLTIGKNEQKDF